MMNRARWLTIVLALILLAGACGSGDGEEASESSTTTAAVTTTTGAADAQCPSDGSVPVLACEPVPVDIIAEYGTDPDFDALADSCFADDLEACDTLYNESPVSDSPDSYEGYGASCGGRRDESVAAELTCVDADEGSADDGSAEDSSDEPAPTGQVEGDVVSSSISTGPNGEFDATLDVDIGDEVVTVTVDNDQLNSVNGRPVIVEPAPSGDGWVFVAPT